MVWHRHGDGRVLFFLLHDDVAAFPANLLESLARQNLADFSAREDTQFGHFQLAGSIARVVGMVGIMDVM